MKAKFFNAVYGFFNVAALMMAISVTPQQASAAQSDEYDAGKAYFAAQVAALGSFGIVAGAEHVVKTEREMLAPVGGERAIKLMQSNTFGYNSRPGHVEMKVKLNAERIREIEEYVRKSKPDIITLHGQDAKYSTKVHYDKLDRPINMREVRATLKRAEAGKTPIGRVEFTTRNNGGNFSLYYQAPGTPKYPKTVKSLRGIRKTTGWLTAVPLTAWLIDKNTQAAGIPQSRKGYVADRFEKALDTVVGKFSSKSSGKTKANGAN